MQPPIAFDFVNRANADYIDQMQQRYQRDPRSVPEVWQAFFAGFEIGYTRADSSAAHEGNGRVPAARSEDGSPSGDTVPFTMGVYDMVHSFRELGHFVAHLDPLG